MCQAVRSRDFVLQGRFEKAERSLSDDSTSAVDTKTDALISSGFQRRDSGYDTDHHCAESFLR